MAFLLLLQKKFFRRFMDGRAGPWGVLAITTFSVRTLWRWSKRNEEVAYRTVLRPGETVTVAHSTDTEASLKRHRRRSAKPPRRASRRDRRKAARRSADV